MRLSMPNTLTQVRAWYENPESRSKNLKDLLESTRIDASDDDTLAAFIEADGRERLARGMRVELGAYLRAFPNLVARQVPLDAAVDVSLRSLAKVCDSSAEATAALRDRHPELATIIAEAGFLARALGSTAGPEVEGPKNDREVPSDFGPRLGDGRARYQLVRRLGKGSFSDVFLAHDRNLSDGDHAAFVAIKIPRMSGAGRWARERFIEEAGKARRVDHPNVVKVLDRGVSDDGEEFIVYEHVEGGDLATWMESQPRISPRKAAELVAQISRGVHAAHSAGLVHCDLKPANILMTADGCPKVADFGFAVRRTDEPSPSSPGLVGTLAFLSPEQYRLDPLASTVPSDVYALGGLLYFLLTSKLPNGSTVDEIALRHASEHATAPSARSANPAIDSDLDEVCSRALNPMRELRHASAAALAEDLEAWSRREPIVWTRPSIAKKASLWARRRPGIATTAALATVVSAATGGFAIDRSAAAAEAARLAELERGFRDTARLQLAATFASTTIVESKRFSMQLLPLLTVWTWMKGTKLLNDQESVFLYWSIRESYVNELLRTRRAAGEADSAETIMWETCLAFWKAENGRFEDALPLLDANIESWATHFGFGDRTTRQVIALREAVRAEIALQGLKRPKTAAERKYLRQMAQTIEDLSVVFDGDYADTNLRIPCLRVLEKIYGRRYLNDKKKIEQVDWKLGTLPH